MAAAKAASSIPVGNNNPASIAARREAGGYAKIGAREHTINAIKGFDRQPLPLDLYLRAYFFKEAPDIAKNLTMRRQITTTAFGLVTWKGLLHHLCDPAGTKFVSWEERYEKLMQVRDPIALMDDTKLPGHVRASIPQFVFDLLAKQYDQKKLWEILKATNRPPPLVFRANPAKISRDELIQKLTEKYKWQICATKKSALGFQFVSRPNMTPQLTDEYKSGLFEQQDEASQLAALMVDAKPGQKVLDFCAGSAGKTLAFAHKMQNTGVIYVHSSPSVLPAAKERLARAAVNNVQFIVGEAEKKESAEEERKAFKESINEKFKALVGQMDWVLDDVPCTGSGVWRRNPDMRWKANAELLERITKLQYNIMTQSLMFLKPQEGKLVYSTCSILKEENEAQIEKLMKEWNLELDGNVLKLLPETGSHDGFFAAVLKQKKLPTGGTTFTKKSESSSSASASASSPTKTKSKLSMLASKILKVTGKGGETEMKAEEPKKTPYWPGQKIPPPSSSPPSSKKK